MIALINPYSVAQSIAMILLVIVAVAIIIYQAKRSSDRECEARCRFDEHERFLEYVSKLTAVEGDALEIFAQDRQPVSLDKQNIIACTGDWTGFSYERFNGRNVLDCLEKAAMARRLREDKKKPVGLEEEIDNGSITD